MSDTSKGKRFVRAAAKMYLILRERSDDNPDWAMDVAGLDDDDCDEFRQELYRIANRLERQVPEHLRATILALHRGEPTQ